MQRNSILILFPLLAVGAFGVAASRMAIITMGKQPDGSFIVSSGQRIEPGAIAFDGRPVDLALHPSGSFFAILNQKNVFLATRDGVIEGSAAPLADGAGYRAAIWTPHGSRLLVSVSAGYVQGLLLEGR